MVKRVFISILLLILFSGMFLKEATAYPQFLGNKVACPVSKEPFAIERNSKKVNYKGKVYYFCCPDCAALFNANQKKYLQAAEEKEGERKQVFSAECDKK